MKYRFNFAVALCFLSSLTISNLANGNDVNLKIEGIKNTALLNNVNAYLKSLADEQTQDIERYQYLVQQHVDKALRAMGYYNTQYQFVYQPSDKVNLLVLNVQLDEPVKLDEVNIQLDGAAQQDNDFAELLAKAPKKSTQLNHEAYENFKSDVESLAQKKGYFDGEWRYHRLEIYPKTHQADWRLGYASGERYRYGEIRFEGNQIREDYLRNILRVDSGAPYFTNDLSKMTSDYSSSKWFSSVVVQPEVKEESKTVDLNLMFVPKKKNLVEIGLGFETDVGPRLQLNWDKPWLNDRGHSIETTSFISEPEQTFELGYNIPVRANPLRYYYQISGGIEREDNNDTISTAATLGLQRFWTQETGWSLSAGVKARYDSFEQSRGKFKTLLLYPTASLNRTRSDGNRFPLWGDSQKLTVNWGSNKLASDVNFYSIKASTAFVRTFAKNHRFYLRGEVGYLKADNFRRMPPALRYFAGGDGSVRGFSYKKISPKDPQGKLSGGTNLISATAEYNYQVYPDWWGAVFYDTGLSDMTFRGKNRYVGAGVGVRWASPIGAIKLDIATPIRTPNNETGVQYYIGLGTEL